MKRELPVFKIEETVFVVDVDKGLLREAANAENIIPFNDMIYKGTHYELPYDEQEKNWPGRYGYNTNPVKEVIIPQLIDLDPIGVSLKYHIPVGLLKDKTDFEIMVDQGLLAERLAGKLPIVDIAGREFIFNYDLMELRLKGDLNIVIKLDGIEDWSIERELLLTFYNVKSMELLQIDPATISEIPKDLVLLEIPYAYKLDPVAEARKEGRPIEEVVIKYPIEAKPILNVIPVEKTNIPILVATNRARALEGDLWPRKRPRKKRGKHL